jgi:hypothetical protein
MPNEFFKTWESMFEVFLGAHDLSNEVSIVKSSIANIIIVIIHLYFLELISEISFYLASRFSRSFK